jgi:hypothetical protein
MENKGYPDPSRHPSSQEYESDADKQASKCDTVVVAISPTLQEMLNRLADSVASAAELVQEIKTQAEVEGLTFQQTRELIIAALRKRKLSDRSIRGHLPAELKNKNMIRRPKFAEAIAANPEPTVETGRTIASTPQPMPEAEHEDEKNKMIAHLANQLAEKTSEMAVQKADIEMLKEEKKELEGQLAKTIVQPASDYAEDPSVLRKRINDQAKLLLPFDCRVNFEIRGQILPLIVKVQPVNKAVSVLLDEAEARRISLA